jgi:hypothetical protein
MFKDLFQILRDSNQRIEHWIKENDLLREKIFVDESRRHGFPIAGSKDRLNLHDDR